MAQSSGPQRPGPQRPAPLPRRVYLLRRLVVLAVPVLLVLLLVWWLTGRGGSSPADAAGTTGTTSTAGTTRSTATVPTTPSPDASSPAAPDPSPTLSDVEVAARAAGVAVCASDDLRVTVEATHERYTGAEKPQLAITIRTTGDETCLLEAGDQNRRVTITSGDDVVWSTNHCLGADPESRRLLLGPGVSSKETFTWSRVRSEPGCVTGRTAPGAGTYTARLQLGGETVGKAVFDLG
ncbi:hypothetical protein KIN34_03100 [Cellulomonas sp. DKR-3]|uniref:Serine/threonine protein kinase n=1 Tax=Cellulomonas fulva TaxID=2835530 RepID=A0ABS5TVT4_9CELL|nr:hypothetical protein [Cellulomonas fulva]MBT0993274.1 hypothetical protein [Cellulomonas fulva]